mgnify:CR=1 FL=1
MSEPDPPAEPEHPAEPAPAPLAAGRWGRVRVDLHSQGLVLAHLVRWIALGSVVGAFPRALVGRGMHLDELARLPK